MIREVKNKYLTQFIWIFMGECVRDEGTGFLFNVNIRFESFLKGMNGCVCLRRGWCRKA